MAELQMQGDKHTQVNSGLIKIVQSVFQNQKIKIYCDKKHQNELSKHIVNIDYIEYKCFEYTGDKELKKKYTLHKTIREIFLAFKIFKENNQDISEIIIFFSAFPFTALFLNLFSKIFKQKIIICLHGDIGVLSLKRNKITIRIFRYAINLFFKTRNLNTIALFYGEPIKDKLFKMFPSFEQKNVITIDQPYNYEFNEVSNNTSIHNKSNVIIGNIGTGIMNKNSHLLYKLAEIQKDNVISGKIKFVQIGNVSSEVQKYSNQYVEIVNDNKFIPFKTFEENIIKADYFIYFFSENSLYDLCPSGTFFDAIKYRKPIISLYNPFFNHYFKKFGNIGYLCNSIEEMNIVINNILNGQNKDYSLQVNSLAKASEALSIENIAKIFYLEYFKIN